MRCCAVPNGRGRALHYSKSDVAIRVMHDIKRAFDPHMIMQPYKYLPAPAAHE